VDWAALAQTTEPRTRPLGTPPIASVAGDASASAALAEVSGALASARDEGRLVQRIPLADIDAAHLVRDRLPAEDEAMQSLVESLRARGQQTPIEVVELGQGQYGLISGWRRLTALNRLYKETGDDRFAGALALLRRPAEAADSYVAMVEENEIRVGLSYYERARIVLRSVEEGVYPTQKAALQSLFSAASRAKRSKIKSFIPVVEALDGVLRFPTEIGERLGLRLGKALEEDPGTADRLRASLDTWPNRSVEEEAAILVAEIERQPPLAAAGGDSASVRERAGSRPAKEPTETGRGLRLETRPGRVVLSGAAVDDGFIAALSDWLSNWTKG
jgi:ParB-like chromosome segregation protein Spo0J